MNSYRELIVWNLGKSIAVDVYKLTKNFPREEIFALVSQMRRAAVSIPSNIAEGFNRYSRKEFSRFLRISLGSCAELETQLELSVEFGFTPIETIKPILSKLTEESKMLKKLTTPPTPNLKS